MSCICIMSGVRGVVEWDGLLAREITLAEQESLLVCQTSDDGLILRGIL